MCAKILVVDDEEDIRESLKMLLENLGYEVFEAESGEDALEKLSALIPNLIICDFFMPKMSGRETISTIREDDRLKDTKIIFLTVAELTGDEFKNEMETLNISEYIKKPLDVTEFTKVVQRLLST